LSSQPESLGTVVYVRRRRTRRHQRNRRIQLLLTLSGVLTFGFALVALRYLSPSLFKASHNPEPSREAVEASRDHFLATQQEALRSIENRPVYPYSIVPGGVKDAQELKWAAQHDPVVASHYAGFDYDHARIVRLVLARTVYVSYRIGNKIYWTRHRLSLKKGESLITDGKITARTRCGNRVEEVPQQATSQSEPPAAKFDEPVPNLGTALSQPPVPFQSTLLTRPPVPGLGPAPPLGLYDPLGGGHAWVPIAPPPLPGVCGIGKKPAKNGVVEVVSNGKKKKTIEPCPSGGGTTEVPEPGTWLLFASGLVFLYWTARRRLTPTQ
jgi:hypothetical protein